MCRGALPVWLSVYQVLASWRQRPEEGIGYPETGIIDHCVYYVGVINYWTISLAPLKQKELELAVKKNEIIKSKGKWLKLENIILSEVTQAEKDKYHMSPTPRLQLSTWYTKSSWEDRTSTEELPRSDWPGVMSVGPRPMCEVPS